MGRAVAPGEPLWLEEDRQWALALWEVEADACPDCRKPWGEVTDPAHEGRYATELVTCHACAASAAAVRKHEEGNGETGGLHVNAELKKPRPDPNQKRR